MSVIVVGAGPTGLMLAGDLARDGVPVKVLERRAEESNLTRAFAIHARTLELLDMRGIADELIAQGLKIPEIRPRLLGGARSSFSFNLRHPESRFPYVLMIPQARTEALLEWRARELGVEIVRGAEVTGLHRDDDGVTLTVNGTRTERADYVVGSDGAHSAVRRLLDVGFSGRSYYIHILLADARIDHDGPPAINTFVSPHGVALIPPYGDGWFRVIVWDRTGQHIPLDRPLGIQELRDSVHRMAGNEMMIQEIRWSTRFLSERRQASNYRVGRVFLAGDAAHVHSPMGAMGMSTGIQDAVNLAWKLTATHEGWAPSWLLDSYHTERHPAGRAALRLTDGIARFALAPAPVRAIRPYLADAILKLGIYDRVVRPAMSGLGVSYRVPDGTVRSPGAGRRVPDLSLSVDDRPVRLYELARGGRFLLVDTARDGATARAAEAWKGRVDTIHADRMPTPATSTLLVRPDGYLAWSGLHPGEAEARMALHQWCGGGGGAAPGLLIRAGRGMS